MIKNRKFMMGLGMGLVLGAVLLQLMLIGEKSMMPVEEQELTKEQVIKAAESLDLQVVESSEELLTEEQWKEQSKKNKESATKPADTKQPEAPQEPKDAKKTKSPEKLPDDKGPSVPEDPKPTEIPFVIEQGNLADVAKGLQEAGIISDQEAFIEAATAKGINRFIQQGTYYFTPGEDYNSIISKISANPPEKPPQ